MDEQEKKGQKDIAFYASCVQAWINTRMEVDKSILTLSTGGIGLLVTLLISIGIDTVLELIVYIAAIVFFLITISINLYVFERNSEYLEKVIENENPKSLKGYDTLKKYTFIFALILALLIGFNAGLKNL